MRHVLKPLCLCLALLWAAQAHAQGLVEYTRKHLPPGIPRIDWTNPLTRGLVAVYLPSAGTGQKVYNLAVPGSGDLTFSGVASPGANTKEGYGLDQHGAANSFVSTTAPASLKGTSASVYWRGYVTSTPSAFAMFFGVDFDNAGGAPHDAYGVCENGSLVVVLCGNGAGVQFFQGGGSLVANTITGLGATVPGGGTATLYINGLQSTTVATGGNPSYTATSEVAFGLGTNTTEPAVNLAGYIWNRALSSQEMASIDLMPYQFLIFPSDDILNKARGLGVR